MHEEQRSPSPQRCCSRYWPYSGCWPRAATAPNTAGRSRLYVAGTAACAVLLAGTALLPVSARVPAWGLLDAAYLAVFAAVILTASPGASLTVTDALIERFGTLSIIVAGALAGPAPGLSPTRRCPMATTSTSTVVGAVESVFTEPEQLALAGFLAGYTGLTREAYALDLRQFASWCQQHHIGLFQARRADIECFARDLEARGRARATITRRLCTVAGFYRYAVEEELLDHSPAARVRRPRLDYESHATGLDRNELGAILVAAGLGAPAEHALISLLALNGLRVSEATGANIEALGVDRGHRTLVVTRKGGKVVTVPLAPRTARAIDLAIGERVEGPVFLAADGRRLDRHGAGRMVRRVARRAGITKQVGPHTLRHAFIPAALDAGVSLRDVQEAASHAGPAPP